MKPKRTAGAQGRRRLADPGRPHQGWHQYQGSVGTGTQGVDHGPQSRLP